MDYWVVELVYPGYGSAVGGLCSFCYDFGRGIYHKPELCADELANLSSDGLHHAHSCVHLQHANEVDRPV
jgi:hypothetical protein